MACIRILLGQTIRKGNFHRLDLLHLLIILFQLITTMVLILTPIIHYKRGIPDSNLVQLLSVIQINGSNIIGQMSRTVSMHRAIRDLRRLAGQAFGHFRPS